MNDTSRNMVLVGIKLMGLWLLFHSVIGLAQSASTGGTMYHRLKHAESREAWQAPEGISDDLAAELNEKRQMEDSMRAFGHEMQMIQAWASKSKSGSLSVFVFEFARTRSMSQCIDIECEGFDG